MSRVAVLSYVCPLAALFALTGGFGLLAPRIVGLSDCGDFGGGALVLIFVATVVSGVVAVFATACGERIIGVRVGLLGAVIFGSGLINIHLDQDPLGAWLNWEAPHLPLDPEWGYGIANHSQIRYSEKHHVFYACGSMTPYPALVKDEYPTLEPYQFDDYAKQSRRTPELRSIRGWLRGALSQETPGPAGKVTLSSQASNPRCCARTGNRQLPGPRPAPRSSCSTSGQAGSSS